MNFRSRTSCDDRIHHEAIVVAPCDHPSPALSVDGLRPDRVKAVETGCMVTFRRSEPDSCSDWWIPTSNPVIVGEGCLGFGRVLWKMSGWLGGIFWPSRIHEDLEFGACLWSWKLDILAGTKKAYYSRTQCASSVRSRKSWQQQVSFFPLPPPPLPPLCSKMFHCGNSADWARDTDRRGRRQYIKHSVMQLNEFP